MLDMSENNEKQGLIQEIQDEVEKLLQAENLSEEQKVSALRAVLRIFDGEKKEDRQ